MGSSSRKRQRRHRKRKKSSSRSSREKGRRDSVYLSSDTEPELKASKKADSSGDEIVVLEDTRTSKESTPETFSKSLKAVKPIDDMIKPKLSKMTEDLRAKVKAMLQNN